MLQRIQSLFLLLASAAMFLLFWHVMSLISIANNVDQIQNASESMLSDGIFNIHDHVILMILGVLSGLLAFVAIWLFNDRGRQMLVTRFALISAILFFCLAGFLFYLDYNRLSANTLIEVEFGVLSPIAAILFCALALRFIKKDDDLVRSSDRLR